MHDDGPVSLDEMIKQYRGNTLPELLDIHLKTIRKKMLPQVLRGTFIEFDPDLLPDLNKFTDDLLQKWLEKPDIATIDLGELLNDTINDVNQMSAISGITPDDSRKFDLFHIIVLKLALRSHSEADIQKKLCLSLPTV